MKRKREYNQKNTPSKAIKPAGQQAFKVRNKSGGNKQAYDFLGDDEFIVDGLSAINEFIRFNPKKIVYVVVDEKDRSKLFRSENIDRIKLYTNEEWQRRNDASFIKSNLWAVIRVAMLQEADLYRNIGNGKEPKLILALDHITDPRNLGAIARTCGFFGVNFILLPKDRQVKLTNASVATSQGGFSLVELFCVTNLVRSLKKLKEMDYWIIGADMGGEDYKDVAGFYDKTVLVLGSEGSGLSHIVRKSCDRIVAIGGREDGLESLNVSVAAGIIIDSFVRP